MRWGAANIYLFKEVKHCFKEGYESDTNLWQTQNAYKYIWMFSETVGEKASQSRG